MIGRAEHCGHMEAATPDTLPLDELQGLLEQQLELAHRGSLAGLDKLGERANAIVAQIAGAGLTDSPAFRGRKLILEKLYQELYLTLAAQRQETATVLRTIRRGKRTIAAYRHNP